MASTGFFPRLANVWRGFLSLWISDVERRNPEIAYQNALDAMLERYAELRHATAALVRRRDDLEQRLGAAARELARVEQDLGTAVDTSQDELALVLIEKQRQLAEDIVATRSDLESAGTDAESAKS